MASYAVSKDSGPFFFWFSLSAEILNLSRIILRLESLLEKRLLTMNPAVEMPYRTIYEVVMSDRPSSLFLTLWEPPRIYDLTSFGFEQGMSILMGHLRLQNNTSLPRPPARKRLSHIPHLYANHSEVLGQSLVYCITVSPEELASKMERLRGNDYLNSYIYKVPVAFFGSRDVNEELVSFKHTLRRCSATIPFDILYQFQALVQNGYLLPRTADILILRLENLSVHGGRRRAENVGKSEAGNLSSRFPFSAGAVKSKISDPSPIFFSVF